MRIIDRIHLRLLVGTLNKFNGNLTHTAQHLGLSLRTVRTWCIRFKLKEPGRQDFDTWRRTIQLLDEDLEEIEQQVIIDEFLPLINHNDESLIKSVDKDLKESEAS